MIEANREFNVKNKSEFEVDNITENHYNNIIVVSGDVKVNRNLTPDIFNYKLKGVMVK